MRRSPTRGHRSWARFRHDRLADSYGGLVDRLDSCLSRMAVVTGVGRLRLELDEKALGAGRKQKDDSAVLPCGVFDIMGFAIDEVLGALVHMNVFDAGEAGRDRGVGLRVDRRAGAENGDQRAGGFSGLRQRFLELILQCLRAWTEIVEFLRIDKTAAHEIQLRHGWLRGGRDEVRGHADFQKLLDQLVAGGRAAFAEVHNLILQFGRLFFLPPSCLLGRLQIDRDAIGGMFGISGLHHEKPMRASRPLRTRRGDLAQ